MMDWKQPQTAGNRAITPRDLKICELCGTLNHLGNAECFTCGWHGLFNHDPAMLQLAWQRLDHQHEGIRLEHVAPSRRRILEDFGRRGPSQLRGRWRTALRNWWTGVLTHWSPRSAARDIRPHSQTAIPPNELGV